jgi:predicted nuclease of predicted toxin-antitoxin system
MLKFLLDENIRVEIKDFLESKELEAKYAPKGASNSEIASLVKKEKAVLLTHDKHWLDTELYPPEEFFGIVVISIPPSMLKEITLALDKLLTKVKEFTCKLIVVELTRFRIVEGKKYP